MMPKKAKHFTAFMSTVCPCTVLARVIQDQQGTRIGVVFSKSFITLISGALLILNDMNKNRTRAKCRHEGGKLLGFFGYCYLPSLIWQSL